MRAKKRVVRRRPSISPDMIVELVRQAGDKGATARELSKLLPGHPCPFWISRTLVHLGCLRHAWSPCADAATHHAAQEGRYWIR